MAFKLRYVATCLYLEDSHGSVEKGEHQSDVGVALHHRHEVKVVVLMQERQQQAASQEGVDTDCPQKVLEELT